METILRASSDAPMRQEALETFDALLSEVCVQHTAMQDALQCAGILPLDANDPITRFIDTRDALETQMHALGAALYQALTAGHGDTVAELVRAWPTMGKNGPQTASVSQHDSQPTQKNQASPARLSERVADATDRLDRITVPPEQETPIAAELHLQTSERVDAAASFRASSAQVEGGSARIHETHASATSEGLPTQPLKEPAADTREPSRPEENRSALDQAGAANDATPSQDIREVSVSRPALTVTEIHLDEEAPPPPQAEAKTPKKSAPRFVTRVAAPADKTKNAVYPSLSLDSLVKPAEERKILAKVTPAPPPRLAKVDEALVSRLNGSVGVKDFVEKLPDNVPHYFIETDQLTQTQLERLNKVLKQLTRPPSGSISNFPAYVGALGAFISPAHLEDFAYLSKELCLSVMKVAVAYHRFLKQEDSANMFADTFKDHWSAIRRFTTSYDAGFISDMSRDAQAKPGPTWREATHARLAELERLLEAKLSAVQAKNAENSKAKREKQSEIDKAFNAIERLIKAMMKDTSLAVARAKIERNAAQRPSDAATPQVHRRKKTRAPRMPQALAHGKTLEEEKIARKEKVDQIAFALTRLLEIGCRPDHPRLLSNVAKLGGEIELTGELQPIQEAFDEKEKIREETQDAPDDTKETWPFRAQVTEGKSAFIVGGNRNSDAEKRIQDHFGFDEVKWHTTNSSNKGKKQMTAVQRGMRDGRYDFYIAIENFVGHAWTWMIFGADAADNVHPVLISGYGVRALELELERTLRLKQDTA